MAQTVVIEIAARYTDRVSQGLNRTRSSADRLSSSLTRTQQRADRLGRTRTNIELSLRDRALQGIERTYNRMKSLAGRAWSVTVRLADKATKPLQGIIRTLKNPVLQVGAAIGVTVGAKDALDTYVGFEKSMSNVQAISGASAENMERLTAKAREMGRTTTKSASEAADAMGYMALASWDADKILQGIQPVLRLSEAGDMDLGRTSDLVTDSMSALGLDTSELQGYLDKVAKTSASSNTNIDSMMSAFLEFGGTVRQNDMLLEDASALIGILANRGVKGAEAGNALNSVLTNLTTGMGQAGKAMEELGISAFEENGKFKGYAETLQAVYDATKDMNDEQKNYYLSAIGGKVRLSDLQKMMSGVVEEYGDLKDKIADSNGALEEMAHIMSDNIYGDMKAFQSAFDDLKIAIVDQFQPHIRRFIQWMTRGMLAINEPVEKMAKNISEKLENTKKRIDRLTKSFAWKNTDLSGKIKLAWDKVIAEPFEQWWSSKGQAWFEEKARNIGYGIGSGLSGGLLALLGIPVEDAANSGLSIGKSFAQGFIDGFDADAVWNALKAKLAEGIQSAGKIMPGGEEATGGSWLWAGLLGAGALKLGRGALKLNGVGGIGRGVQAAERMSPNALPFGGTGVIRTAAGSEAMGTTVAGLAGSTAATRAAQRTKSQGKVQRITGVLSTRKEYEEFWKNKPVRVVTRESAITDHAIATKQAEKQAIIAERQAKLNAAARSRRDFKMNAVISARREEALLAEVTAEAKAYHTARDAAKKAAARAGRLQGAKKLIKGNGLSLVLAGVSIAAADNKKQETVRQAGGLSGSMLGGTAGAKIGFAIGSAIAPGIGSAIGSAIGGLAGSILGYAGGTEIGQKVYNLFKTEEEKEAEKTEKAITAEKEKQSRLEEQMYQLSDSYDMLQGEKERIQHTKDLAGAMQGIQKYLDENNVEEEERLSKQQEINDSFQSLVDMYPELLSQSDLENGKLQEKLDLIERMNQSQKEMQRHEFKEDLEAVNKNADTMKKNYWDAFNEKEDALSNYDKLMEDKQKIDSIFAEYSHRNIEWKQAKKLGETDKAKMYHSSRLQKAEELRGSLKDAGADIGDLMRSAQSKGKGTFDYEEIEEFFNQQIYGANKAINASLENFTLKQQDVQTIYDKNLADINYDVGEQIGMSLEEAISKYDELDATTQAVIRAAIERVEELNDKWGALATTKFGDFILRVRGENLELLDRYPVFKTGASRAVAWANVATSGNFIMPHAQGDIVSKAEVALIGEAGPEAIIPLSGTNKHRGVKLWQETGEMLGTLPKHARGGIFGGVVKPFNQTTKESSNSESGVIPPVTVNLGGMNFSFQGADAESREGVMTAIRAEMPQITNELADELAKVLAKVFSNMKMQPEGI